MSIVFLSPETLNSLIEHYGTWIVTVFVGLEGMGVPLPGETVLILASAYAGSHHESIAKVIAGASAGAIIGDNIGFWVGRLLGRRFLQRYGGRFGLTEGRLKLGQYLFMQHGRKVVFFGRFIALLRFLAAFLAGANRMQWSRFFPANAAGGVTWATVVGAAAYAFGSELHRLHGTLSVIFIGLGIGALAWLFSYISRNEAHMLEAAEKALPGSPT